MFYKLSGNARQLLNELSESENPTKCLNDKFKACPKKQEITLRSIIKELSDEGYITVMWADNIPWLVSISNDGKTYEERLKQCEDEQNNAHMSSISIGNNNKIYNSVIAGKVANDDEKRGFFEKHPVLAGTLAAVIAGFILMFGIWEKIVVAIEKIFSK